MEAVQIGAGTPTRPRHTATCSKGNSIFDVVMKCEGIGFEDAKVYVAESIGRQDLLTIRWPPPAFAQ
jgi:hypothetical protein